MYFFSEDYDLDLIGVSGKIGSGKDYLSKSIAWKLGFIPVPLALHFKVEAAAHGTQDFSIDQIFGLDRKDRENDLRNFLQQRGTEQGRDVFGDDIWCKHTEAYIYHLSSYGYRRFIIPDVRFQNELDWIQSLNGKVIRVLDRGGESSYNHHVSETSLSDDMDVYDAKFSNPPELDSTAVERFENLVRELVMV